MNQIFCDAIHNRCVLELTYRGHHVVAEPHAYGLSLALNEVIGCYQTGGTSHSRTVPGWKMMRVDRIEFLTVTEEHFVGVRAGYLRGDICMPTIFCEL